MFTAAPEKVAELPPRVQQRIPPRRDETVRLLFLRRLRRFAGYARLHFGVGCMQLVMRLLGVRCQLLRLRPLEAIGFRDLLRCGLLARRQQFLQRSRVSLA
jgi:hypothetical protein